MTTKKSRALCTGAGTFVIAVLGLCVERTLLSVAMLLIGFGAGWSIIRFSIPLRGRPAAAPKVAIAILILGFVLPSVFASRPILAIVEIPALFAGMAFCFVSKSSDVQSG